MSEQDDAKVLIEQAQKALDQIQSYSCVVVCQERMQGKMRPTERILSYFKKPNSVYLRWLAGPYEGLQTSYVPERDGQNKFMARETGLRGMVGTVSWASDSPLIDKMYPHYFRTHETSVVYLISLIRELQERAERLGKLHIESMQVVQDPLLKQEALRIVTRLSDRREDGLRWPKTELYGDPVTQLPLHFKLYDFDGGLYGEYAFTEFVAGAPVNDDVFTLKKL